MLPRQLQFCCNLLLEVGNQLPTIYCKIVSNMEEVDKVESDWTSKVMETFRNLEKRRTILSQSDTKMYWLH